MGCAFSGVLGDEHETEMAMRANAKKRSLFIPRILPAATWSGKKGHMTDTDIEIVKFDYEHEEKLCAEIAENKSFVGTMVSIAAFVALEWAARQPLPQKPVVVIVFGLLIVAAVLFLVVSLGKTYKTVATPKEWIDSRTDYVREHCQSGGPDDSDRKIKEMFYRRLLATTEINRSITRSRQKAVEWAGALSAAAIVAIVIESTWRYVFS